MAGNGERLREALDEAGALDVAIHFRGRREDYSAAQTKCLERAATEYDRATAERIAELEARCARYEESEGAWHFATVCHDGADALHMINGLRERIAKLTATAEKSFDLNLELVNYPDAYFRQKWRFEETLAEIAAELGKNAPKKVED